MKRTAPTPGISSGVGAAARVERSNALDAWLATLLPDLPGAALVAVGGLGRREMAPYSDIDLVLVHTEDCAIDPAQVWYPIWDAGFKLDHSARTQEQALAVADTDVKAALGLLDARLLAGDRGLAQRLHQAIVLKWRREAPRILPALRQLTEQRWERYGELAFLLEGDLKEAHGGLRDVGVLRGLGYAGVADGTRPAVRAAHNFLLDVRDALHNARARRIDHLLAQERGEVARQLELADGDALLRRITDRPAPSPTPPTTPGVPSPAGWAAGSTREPRRPAPRWPATSSSRTARRSSPARRLPRSPIRHSHSASPRRRRAPGVPSPARRWSGWPRMRNHRPGRGLPEPATRSSPCSAPAPAWCRRGRPATATAW